MLKEITGNNMTVICNNCNALNVYDLTSRESVFLQEFGEYENLNFDCPFCDTIESFNMNIPINDTDEPFATGDLPIEEEVQRAYVRILMRMVREDLKK